MAQKTLFEYNELTTPANGDAFPVVDISDTTHAVSGTTKWIKLLTLLRVGSVTQAWSAVLDTFSAKTPPSGVIVGNTDSQTLTNKTMDYNSNTFQNFPGASTDGYLSTADTWTYASATSFTIAGVNRTTQFPVGTRIKLTQTTAKYFVVTSSTFSTDTTVNIYAGTSYTLANAAITSPYYSYQASPQGFPYVFNYTPTPTGFSVVPSSATYRFSVIGNKCTLMVSQNTNGTSNATTFAIPLPITSKTLTDALWIGFAQATDNGSNLTSPALAQISSNSTVVNIYKDYSGASWTGSGNKKVFGFTISYEI